MLDEMERALHDALCIVKRTLESNVVVLWRRSLSSLHYRVFGVPCNNFGISGTVGNSGVS
ncbi:hypothetical protein MKW92_031194 [Papaver armeniacum]|nr:hypothetical protein MKW92_031194 [Papaver armeniacum]